MRPFLKKGRKKERYVFWPLHKPQTLKFANTKVNKTIIKTHIRHFYKYTRISLLRIFTGNPHVPPSTIVAKIMDCILQDEVCREEALMKTRHSIADLRSPAAVHAHLTSRLKST